MELKYVHSESTVRPDLIHLNFGTVYIRKDIAETTRDDVVYYTYQEATLTQEEYDLYLGMMSIELDKNQLVIMNAIADLYDAIANLSATGGTT